MLSLTILLSRPFLASLSHVAFRLVSAHSGSSHKGGRRAVMADVAKLAGVSQQTVSRVINGSGDVRAATRERVRHAVEMLDYRPNSAARALATGRSRTLGVVRVDTALYGPSSTLFGIERAAHAAGYHVSVASQRWLDLDSTLRAVERLRTQGIEGILVIG